MSAIKPSRAKALACTPTRARGAGGQVSTCAVGPGELEATVHDLAMTPGARLADVFAAGNSPIVLRLVWALDSSARYLIIETTIDGDTYPPLSDIAPAAFAEECEIYEQFGIRPAGGKPLNRVAVPPMARPDFPRLGRAPAAARET
jgi:Ni,Fe-hydrogenase III component G